MGADHTSKKPRTESSQAIALLAFVLSILSLGSIVTSCNYRVDKLGASGPGRGSFKAGEAPSFEQVRVEVLEKRCTSCHGEGDPLNLHLHEVAVARLADIRDRITRSDSAMMPPKRPLNESDKALLLAWIDAGGPLNGSQGTPAPSPTPDPSVQPSPSPSPTPGATPAPTVIPGWKTVFERIVDKRCTSCHSSLDETDYSTYPLFKASLTDIRDRLVRPLTDKKRMPKGQPLSPEDMTLILSWIDAGAPEQETTVQPSPTPAPVPTPGQTPLPSPSPGPGSTPTATPQASPQPSATPVATPSATPEPTPLPVQIEPTYESINQHIFVPRCANCHTGDGDGAFMFDMTDLTSIIFADEAAITKKDPVSSYLIKSVTRTDKRRMPPPPRPALSEEEIEVLKTWIGKGAPP